MEVATADARNAGRSISEDTSDVAATEDGFSAGAATAAGADAALRSGSAAAQDMPDLAAAWMRYGGEVMRQTADASRAQISCRSLPEMIEVQARLLRGNLQAFFDQSTKISEIAGRIAARPFEAIRGAGAGQPPR
ncbi:MAG: phasin family protein [Stellaceae bacterium]